MNLNRCSAIRFRIFFYFRGLKSRGAVHCSARSEIWISWILMTLQSLFLPSIIITSSWCYWCAPLLPCVSPLILAAQCGRPVCLWRQPCVLHTNLADKKWACNSGFGKDAARKVGKRMGHDDQKSDFHLPRFLRLAVVAWLVGWPHPVCHCVLCQISSAFGPFRGHEFQDYVINFGFSCQVRIDFFLRFQTIVSC